MLVLSLDTSSLCGSVALVAGGHLRAEERWQEGDRHGAVLFDRIARLLASAGAELGDVELFAVGLGPGSFTGLRVGLAAAKGLAFATGRPLRGVSSMRALARGMAAGGAEAGAPAPRGSSPGEPLAPSASLARPLVPVVDAHKGEVFAACYRGAGVGPVVEVVGPFHAPPERAGRRLREALGGEASPLLAGSGVAARAGAFHAGLGEPWRRGAAHLDAPRAAMVALEAVEAFTLEGPSDLGALEPHYLRGSDARLPDRPLRVPGEG